MQAQLAEQERQRQQGQAAKFAMRQAALAEAMADQLQPSSATADPTEQASMQSTQSPSNHPIASMEVVQQRMPQTASSGGHSETSGRKRRRNAVDYIALNKQLEAEAASSSGQSVLKQGTQPAAAPLAFVTDVPSSALGVHATSRVPNQRPDSPLDATALHVGHQCVNVPPQTHEGDKT